MKERHNGAYLHNQLEAFVHQLPAARFIHLRKLLLGCYTNFTRPEKNIYVKISDFSCSVFFLRLNILCQTLFLPSPAHSKRLICDRWVGEEEGAKFWGRSHPSQISRWNRVTKSGSFKDTLFLRPSI